jgi:hypothetical protein
LAILLKFPLGLIKKIENNEIRTKRISSIQWIYLGLNAAIPKPFWRIPRWILIFPFGNDPRAIHLLQVQE